MGAFAWVTLATNDSYSLGALVLAHSLKQAGTVHQLAVLVTPGVTSAMREKLSSVFNIVQEVNILDSRDEANLRLLKRPELGVTFTKLHCWRLTQFEKCIFLDADTLVLQNSDELFEREEFSAAPDVGWPDCFNSGVFVYRPSLDTYEKLIQFALEKGSFDGGDQGLLNLYFSDWAHKDISKHLPFIYNLCSTACYSYLPAFKQFGANAKIIHFIGAQKPWLQYFNTETRKVQPSEDSTHLQEVLQRWWDIFCSLIHPHLSPAMQGQSQHGISPSYVPPQYDPPTNPTASADDYENTWDPWDEYDQKVAQNAHYTLTSTHYNQNQSIESLNTNAGSVADQPNIHSQPQPHNYNTYSFQHNSYYQPPPPQVVYHAIPRVPTPPPTPRPEHSYQQPEVHHHQQHYHSELQNVQHSEPQVFQHVPQTHQEHSPQQYYSDEPQAYQYERHSPDHAQHQDYDQSHFVQVHQHNESHEPIHHPPDQSSSYQKDEQVRTYESFSHTPERPGSPNRPTQIPLLPKEFEATTTVSNDMSLHSTVEDSSKQEDAGLAGAFSQLTLGVARTVEQDALENVLRKQAWEVGNIDYLGRDSFENIWSKITETLGSALAQPEAESEVPAAPAESQSQTVTQEEAFPVQPPVLPLDTSTIDNIPSTDATTAASSSAEVPKESQPTSEVPVAVPSVQASTEPAQVVADTATTEATVVGSKVEEPKEISPSVIPVEEVVSPAEPKPEVTSASTQESVAEPVADLTREPVAEPVAEPATELAKEPGTEPVAELAKESVAELAKETAVELAKEPLGDVVTEPLAELATEPPVPAKESVSEPAKEPVAEVATEPVAELATEPLAELATEPAAELASKPAAELATKPAAELTIEPAAQLVKDPAAETVIESVAGPVTEPLVCPIPQKKDVTEEAPSPDIQPASVPAPVQAISTEPESLKESQPVALPESSQVPVQATSAQPEVPASRPKKKMVASQSPLIETESPAVVGWIQPLRKPCKKPSSKLDSAATPPTSSPSAAEIPGADISKEPEPVGEPAATVSAPKAAETGASKKSSPKTKVTEATPPATPATPPVEKTKEALTPEATVPETPPPSEEGSTPTPPPRKTDKPKKVAAKQKK